MRTTNAKRSTRSSWILRTGATRRTGARWADLPPGLGDDSTAHSRLSQWTADGTWDRIWHALLAELDEAGKLDGTAARSTARTSAQMGGDIVAAVAGKS